MIGSDKSPIVKLSSHDWLIDRVHHGIKFT